MFKIRGLFFCFALAAAGSHSTAQAAEAPALDAFVLYDSMTVTHAGVTESRQFRNTLIRRPGHVWVERVLPVHSDFKHGHAHKMARVNQSTEAKSGHKHVDFDISAQHLTRDAKGEIRADYVDHQQRQIVFVPRAEYSVSGFDGSWDNAAEIINEKSVKAMPASKRVSTLANAEWREDSRNGWTHRVLWSNQYKIAMIVESVKQDGSASRRTAVTIKPTTPERDLPWKRLHGYAQKEFDDFMD